MRPATPVRVFPALFVLLALAAPAHAATRPYTVTERALTEAPGHLRLEAGIDRQDWDTGNKFYALTPEITYGLHSGLDVEVALPWAVAGGAEPLKDGPGDIRARAKLRLVQPSPHVPLTVSAQAEVKFPTGIDPVSTGQPDVRLAALATDRLGGVTLDGNLFYTFVGEGTGQDFRNVIGMSVGIEAPTRVTGLTGLGEFILEQARVPVESAPFALVGGARYAVTPKLALDFDLLIGWGPGPLPAAGNYERGLGGGFGLTWELGS
jgi:hypothetical protein